MICVGAANTTRTRWPGLARTRLGWHLGMKMSEASKAWAWICAGDNPRWCISKEMSLAYLAKWMIAKHGNE